jgi:hypothetical protein
MEFLPGSVTTAGAGREMPPFPPFANMPLLALLDCLLFWIGLLPSPAHWLRWLALSLCLLLPGRAEDLTDSLRAWRLQGDQFEAAYRLAQECAGPARGTAAAGELGPVLAEFARLGNELAQAAATEAALVRAALPPESAPDAPARRHVVALETHARHFQNRADDFATLAGADLAPRGVPAEPARSAVASARDARQLSAPSSPAP